MLLCRDPGIQKGRIIKDRAKVLLEGYLKSSEKIDWEKVEDGTHPLAALYDEVWGDVEEYETWLSDIKGKVRNLTLKHVKLVCLPVTVVMRRQSERRKAS